MDIKNVSFIGLGVMGYPMAGYLQKNDFNVNVFNRTTAKAEKWSKEYGGKFALTPGEAVINSDAVFICVGRDEDLRDVMDGENGIIKNSKKNVIIVDHTTSSANIAIEYATRCIENNKFFLDAPISGGQAGAENGQLSIMVGGNAEAFNKVKSCSREF